VSNADLPRQWRTPRNLSLDNIIGQIEYGVSTSRTFNNFCENMAFVSHIELLLLILLSVMINGLMLCMMN